MRYHLQDPPREKIESIEKSPEHYYPKLVYKPPILEGEILDESTSLGKKYKLAKEICKETKVINLNEKSTSKAPKKKSKKVSSKCNHTAVETVQEKL